MNKTTNINLGGLFFHIDEIAYTKLRKYLDAIQRSLNGSANEKKEILDDIEARISELLSEKLKNDRQVINDTDIDDVIQIMGQPEDYGDGDTAYDTEETSYNNTSVKKLFRDPTNTMLGGVSSGIGYYFAIDAVWVRLLFILLTISGGFGIPAYIVMWIITPVAKTTADKLQMEGEPVNIESIEKKIKTEFENVSHKIKNADYKSAKNTLQKTIDFLGQIILRLYKIFEKAIGILLICISSIAIISLFTLFFTFNTLGFLGTENLFFDTMPLFQQTTIPQWILNTALFLISGIPFVLLFILGILIISKKSKILTKTVFFVLIGLWILAIITITGTSIHLKNNTAYEGIKNHQESYTIASDTLYINTVQNENILYKEYLSRSNNQELVADGATEKLFSNNVFINIATSSTQDLEVKITKKSKAKNNALALQNAQEITYQYAVNEHEITLNSYFLSPLDHQFKPEAVTTTLFIPLGKIIVFDENTQNFLHNFINPEQKNYWDLTNHYLKMTPKGLICTDCTTNTTDNTNI